MSTAPDSLTSGLDPAQVEAVVCPEQPLAIIAAAGSGKTAVLTRRIAHRIATESAEERHTVALTFSRQAAGELNRRLGALGVRGIHTGTFHAVAFAVLRQRWADQNRPAPALVTARHGLLAEAIRTGAANRRRPEPNELGGELDWARAQLTSPAEYPERAAAAGRRTSASPATIAAAMESYAVVKRNRRVIDFDDLLESTAAELDRDPAFAAQVAWRFRHFFVDEFQDVNPLQFSVLEAFRAGRPDLCVVGDPRQSIYGWNGADPGLLASVEDTYPGIRVVRLQRNYRCAPAVVAAGAAALAAGEHVDDAIAVRPDTGGVALLEAADPSAEAALVAGRLRLARVPGAKWSSMAVLARTNAQLEPIAAALDASGIPYSLPGRAAIVTDDPARRALLSDARHIRGGEELAAWGRDLDDALEESSSPLHRELAAAVRRFLTSVPLGTGPAFVEWFELTGGDDDRPNQYANAVQLLTFHAAKGREWRHVVVVGVERGLVPHGGANAPAAAAEEVRLLYVALTRASDHLIVTWAAERNGRRTGRSPLLDRVVSTTAGAPAPIPADLRSWAERPAEPDLDPVLDALRRWRTLTARVARLPERAVCDDLTLESVAAHRPATIEELAAVPGFGRIAANRLGPRLLAMLAEVAPSAGRRLVGLVD